MELESEKFQTPNGSKTKRVGHLSHSTKKHESTRLVQQKGWFAQTKTTNKFGWAVLIMMMFPSKLPVAPLGV